MDALGTRELYKSRNRIDTRKAPPPPRRAREGSLLSAIFPMRQNGRSRGMCQVLRAAVLDVMTHIDPDIEG